MRADFCGAKHGIFVYPRAQALPPRCFDSTGAFQMRYFTLLLSLICMALTVNSAQADRRVAFVVGNGAYKNVAALPNPPVDAKAMAAALRNVGFEGGEGTNSNPATLT